MEADKGVEALKHRGSTVIRAKVTAQSSLLGFTVADSGFNEKFKARIIALQQSSKQVKNISDAIFASGDLLVLQVSDDSPLLRRPPVDFYQKLAKLPSSSVIGRNSTSLISKSFARDVEGHPEKKSQPTSLLSTNLLLEANNPQGETENASDVNSLDHEQVWRNLQVLFPSNVDEESDLQPKASREFLTAMTIARNSQFIRKTAEQSGLTHLKGVFLVTIERPKVSEPPPSSASSVINLVDTNDTIAIATDDQLQEGDLLWYSGSAESIHDLKKVPGLKSYVSSEIKKINARVHDRRLVQAVIARIGPLVGRSVKEARFRTKYGAAVISVSRNGKRVHDHPGNIRLQAGDVLLLEAGPNFIKDNAESDKSFALIFEVKDSAPPRLKLFIPAVILVVAMLGEYSIYTQSLS